MTVDLVRLQVSIDRAHHAGYLVRKMRTQDAEDIARVHALVWREAYVDLMPADFLAAMDIQTSTGRWREFLSNDDGDLQRLAGVSPGGEIVAIAVSGPSCDEDPPTLLELRSINVLAEHHGTGLADLLMERLIGKQAASLWMLRENVRARTFYERYGFQPDGATKIHEPTSRVDVRMVREGVQALG